MLNRRDYQNAVKAQFESKVEEMGLSQKEFRQEFDFVKDGGNSQIDFIISLEPTQQANGLFNVTHLPSGVVYKHDLPTFDDAWNWIQDLVILKPIR